MIISFHLFRTTYYAIMTQDYSNIQASIQFFRSDNKGLITYNLHSETSFHAALGKVVILGFNVSS